MSTFGTQTQTLGNLFNGNEGFDPDRLRPECQQPLLCQLQLPAGNGHFRPLPDFILCSRFRQPHSRPLPARAR